MLFKEQPDNPTVPPDEHMKVPQKNPWKVELRKVNFGAKSMYSFFIIQISQEFLKPLDRSKGCLINMPKRQHTPTSVIAIFAESNESKKCTSIE